MPPQGEELRVHVLSDSSLPFHLGAIESELLDFVYLVGPTEYHPFREALSAWSAKVRPGGFVGGDGYLNGVLEGRLYGVKTAVDEFAADHRLPVRVTYDKVPHWFFLKPTDRPQRQCKIGLLTAADAGAAAVAQHSLPNKREYCRRHGYEMIVRDGGFDPGRPPAWSKIKFLREHLPDFDWLFWTDADALVMNHTIRLEDLADDEYDVLITQEDVGVGVFNLNTGQMLIRNSEWSRRFLDEVWAQTQFLHDRLWENRAVIHLWERQDLSDHVKVLAQKTFNSYMSNYTKGDFVLHFPDMPNDVRSKLMRVWAQFTVL